MRNAAEDLANGWQYTPNKSLKPTIIVDIDGTIANMNKDVPGARRPYDWDRVGEDTPHQDIIDLVILLDQQHDIIFFSGRSDECYDITRKWLVEHIHAGTLDWPLWMRASGDLRQDTVVKLEMLQSLGDSNIVMTVDDRNSVVAMWRSIGIRCIQVAEGDF